MTFKYLKSNSNYEVGDISFNKLKCSSLDNAVKENAFDKDDATLPKGCIMDKNDGNIYYNGIGTADCSHNSYDCVKPYDYMVVSGNHQSLETIGETPCKTLDKAAADDFTKDDATLPKGCIMDKNDGKIYYNGSGTADCSHNSYDCVEENPSQYLSDDNNTNFAYAKKLVDNQIANFHDMINNTLNDTTHNLADKETTVKIFEKETKNLQDHIDNIKQERMNKQRLVEASEWEYDRYNSHIYIF